MAFRANQQNDQQDENLLPWEQIEYINDQETIVAARSNIDYVIYFDPARRRKISFKSIIREIRKEIAPRYRRVRFVPLTYDDVVTRTPFLTSKDEKLFMEKGYRTSPASLKNLASKKQPRPKNETRMEALKVNFDSFYGLFLKTDAFLEAMKYLTPTSYLPDWLNKPTEDILLPICGSRENWRKGDPAIRVTRQAGLWVGCDNFSVSRKIYPSIAAIYGTAVEQGGKAGTRWYGLTHGELKAQLSREMTGCLMARCDEFEASSIALFMCQNIMRLRLSAELTRRISMTIRNGHTNELTTDAHEDSELRDEIYGKHDIDPETNDISIKRWQPSLVDRVLVAFYGGSVPIPHQTRACEWLRIERLARWAGALRRNCQATLDLTTSADIVGVFCRPSPEFQDLFDSPDAWSAFRTLESFLSKTAWETIERTATVIVEQSNKFTVSYVLNDHGHQKSGAHVDIAQRHVTVVGPALLLPVDNLERLRTSVKTISPRGLYAI
ncbi:hypothetical protein SAMN02799636_04958 [Methylobacterium sp. 275MFSha3.1]|uniref:hypothetical protein n=1 Tax=Methylobacterium sp. 275MFSha3.1 TaxID=1502746 RepID=UPI0008A7883A|nr:hypothetical protein [Methylobacterium sp. 275MFSha3.1]SEI01699.1 hypothetical protein SAMN02799636_04958 [Methylobacterium sp. 275MFSha3.1]